MKIRVLIADDHAVVSEGLQQLLAAHADLEVVGLAHDGRQAVALAEERAADVVVMDSSMPELNGLEATRILLERRPDTKVLMLSMHADAGHVVRALRAGAKGYILKRSAGRDVVEAIRAVYQGRRILPPSLADAVLERLVDEEVHDPLSRLSSRERQVLKMLAEGQSTASIAAILSLSPKTVETYRARIMGKLDIRDFATLVRFAIQQGLSPLE